MKIVVASSGLGHVARGIESWAEDLGRALADRGEAVVLAKGAGEATAPYERVVPCWTRDSARTARLLRAMPKALGWRLGLGSGYGVEQATFALGLIGLLRRERADVLHVQDPQLALIVQRARRLGLVRARTILAHGTEEPLASLRKIEYLQHLAPWHLEEARAAGAWKPSWTAIPNFIDTDRFRPGRSEALRAELGLPGAAPVVLVAAAIKKAHKRIDRVVEEFAEALRRAPGSDARLVVAGGRESDTDEVIAHGEALLGDRVRFLVRFPRERMPDLYRAADLFALGSLKEMMPIALLEATASGLPCLVHRHPVMEWMIGPGGESIDLMSPGAMAHRLAEMLRDAPGRRALGDKARRHCVEHFSRDQVVGRIISYYRFIQHGVVGPSDALATSGPALSPSAGGRLA